MLFNQASPFAERVPHLEDISIKGAEISRLPACEPLEERSFRRRRRGRGL
jgi:hypothetical protein